MNHTTVYMGRRSLNFDGLNSKTTHYKKPDGTQAKHVRRAVDGLEFGVMDGGGDFWVSVGPVILAKPVRIDLARHLDGKKGLGPGQTGFGDKSARRLLADAICQNPDEAEAILEHVWVTIAHVDRETGKPS